MDGDGGGGQHLRISKILATALAATVPKNIFIKDTSVMFAQKLSLSIHCSNHDFLNTPPYPYVENVWLFYRKTVIHDDVLFHWLVESMFVTFMYIISEEKKKSNI